jgi:hypothetical protein
MKDKMRKPIAKSLSDLLPAVLRPALAEHGVATSQLITRWPEIVGEELAGVTRPLKLNWPRLPEGVQKTGATLVLLCESGFALDVQHAAPLILERVNALYGWQAVLKINIRQGQVRQEKAVINQIVNEIEAPPIEGIEEAPLREALQKLGKSVLNPQKD